jgi:hypothetical protein
MDGPKPVGGALRVSEGGGRQPDWRSDGAELYFLRGESIMVVDIRPGDAPLAGPPRVLFRVERISVPWSGTGHGYAVTPDGQRFIAIVPVVDASPRAATVILNWGAAYARAAKR